MRVQKTKSEIRVFPDFQEVRFFDNSRATLQGIKIIITQSRGFFHRVFSQRKVSHKHILLMGSQGHSTGSLVGKGNFCTKFSTTGTTLREITHTY